MLTSWFYKKKKSYIVMYSACSFILFKYGQYQITDKPMKWHCIGHLNNSWHKMFPVLTISLLYFLTSKFLLIEYPWYPMDLSYLRQGFFDQPIMIKIFTWMYFVHITQLTKEKIINILGLLSHFRNNLALPENNTLVDR